MSLSPPKIRTLLMCFQKLIPASHPSQKGEANKRSPLVVPNLACDDLETYRSNLDWQEPPQESLDIVAHNWDIPKPDNDTMCEVNQGLLTLPTKEKMQGVS
eukprot:scaffold10210_cov157-Amphora_coffeaeformis.AAC.2